MYALAVYIIWFKSAFLNMFIRGHSYLWFLEAHICSNIMHTDMISHPIFFLLCLSFDTLKITSEHDVSNTVPDSKSDATEVFDFSLNSVLLSDNK